MSENKTSNPLRIYVDMDDTLCDFKSAYLRDLKANPDIKYPQSQHGFFRDLDRLVIDVCNPCFWINKLVEEGHDVWILTRPSTKNRLCYTEKADWVHKHLGQEWVDKLIICPDKGLLIGDLLIDDTPWPTFQGEQILFGQAGFENWRKVFLHILKKYANG